MVRPFKITFESYAACRAIAMADTRTGPQKIQMQHCVKRNGLALTGTMIRPTPPATHSGRSRLA